MGWRGVDYSRRGVAQTWVDQVGGSGEIRTHGGREPSPVFKTGALNHSATLPSRRAES